MADESIPPRRERSRRESPVPRAPTEASNWLKVIGVVVAAALGGGGTGAFGVSALYSYRLDKLETEVHEHNSEPGHHEAERRLDLLTQSIRRFERDIEVMGEAIGERDKDLKERLSRIEARLLERRR